MSPPPEFRVIVTGCRHWDCRALAERVVSRLIGRYGRENLVIVHGAATGVDQAFDIAAKDAKVAVDPHPAIWRPGRPGQTQEEWERTPVDLSAGPRRNQEMVRLGARFAIAAHRDLWGSKGTRDCVTRCLAAGIPVYLIDSEEGEPVRVRSTPQ